MKKVTQGGSRAKKSVSLSRRSFFVRVSFPLLCKEGEKSSFFRLISGPFRTSSDQKAQAAIRLWYGTQKSFLVNFVLLEAKGQIYSTLSARKSPPS